MRDAKSYLIVTFHTTAAAMAMEKYCLRDGIPGKLIPTPRALSADCGISWSAPIDARAPVEALLSRCALEVDALHELLL